MINFAVRIKLYNLKLKREPYKLSESMGFITQKLSKAIGQRLLQYFNIEGVNFSIEEWLALTVLWDREGLSQQEIADLTDRDKTSMSRIINRLEGEGLVTREVFARDKRNRLIFLTEKGKNLKPLLTGLAEKTLSDAFRGMSDDEIEFARNVLKVAHKNLTGRYP